MYWFSDLDFQYSHFNTVGKALQLLTVVAFIGSFCLDLI